LHHRDREHPRRPAVCGDRPADPPRLMALLEVTDLATTFATDDGLVGAVDRVSFSVDKGKVLGIVGESGSGKSVTNLTLMGLLPENAKVSGSAMLGDKDLLKLSKAELRKVRGNDVAMIFQDPMTSLNPVYSVGDQLLEAISLHRELPKAEARARAVEMLTAVG